MTKLLSVPLAAAGFVAATVALATPASATPIAVPVHVTVTPGNGGVAVGVGYMYDPIAGVYAGTRGVCYGFGYGTTDCVP